MKQTVPCGVAVFLWRAPYIGGDMIEGEFLLGLRKGAHGAGTWSFPGGKVEPNEPLNLAAIREVREETGIILEHVAPVRGLPFNNTLAGGQHWVTLFFHAPVCHHVTAAIKEPEKCEEWRWFPFRLGDWPRLFEPAREFLTELHRRKWDM